MDSPLLSWCSDKLNSLSQTEKAALSLVTAVTGLYAVSKIWSYSKQKGKPIPYADSPWPLGWIQRPDDMIEALGPDHHNKHPGIHRIYIAPFVKGWIQVTDPALAAEVGKRDREGCLTGQGQDIMETVIPAGVLGERDEAAWRRRRKIMAKSLQIMKDENLCGPALRAVVDQCDSQDGIDGARLDVGNLHDKLIFHTFGTLAFGGRFEYTPQFETAMTSIVKGLELRFNVPVPFLWPFFDAYRPSEEGRKYVDNMIDEGLAKLYKELDENNGVPPEPSFVADVIACNEEMKQTEPENALSPVECSGVVFTAIVAGLHTSSTSLAFTTVELAANQVVQEKLYRALVENGLPTDGPLVDPGLLKTIIIGCDYLTWVIKESLRMYPIGMASFREVAKDCKIGDYHLKRGEDVYVSAVAMHKIPEWWKTSSKYPVDEFHPERWEVEKPKRGSGLYLPFGLGRRDCIGQTFAIKEMAMILALLMSRYRFEEVPGYKVEPVVEMALASKSGFWVVPRRRVFE